MEDDAQASLGVWTRAHFLARLEQKSARHETHSEQEFWHEGAYRNIDGPINVNTFIAPCIYLVPKPKCRRMDDNSRTTTPQKFAAVPKRART